MRNEQLTPSALRGVGAGNFFRPRDAADLGFGARDLRRLVDAGTVERIARGLYRLVDAEPTEHYTLGAVCARVPDSIVCLLSALSVHEIGTQMPHEAWIAIPHKARAPYAPQLPIRLIRFSGAALRYGVVRTRFEGVPAHITNPARTLVDCFRFRRIVGFDVAIGAMRESLRSRRVTPDEIRRAAEVLRAGSVIGPVLETLVG